MTKISHRASSLQLAHIFPDSSHVHFCGLGSADDIAIWRYAKEHDFAIVSKGSDFQERSIMNGFPPKVIWLRVTNCTSAEIEELLKSATSIIQHFLGESTESCLILGRQKA